MGFCTKYMVRLCAAHKCQAMSRLLAGQIELIEFSRMIWLCSARCAFC